MQHASAHNLGVDDEGFDPSSQIHQASKTHSAEKHDDDHEEHAHEEGEPWLMSFADLILNLLLFFIVLYSISSVDEKKLMELARAINGEIVPQTIIDKSEDEKQNGEILQEIQALMNKFNNNVASDQQKIKADAVQTKISGLMRTLPGKNQENDLFEVILSGEKYFKSGTSELSPAARAAIQAFAEKLRPIQNEIGLYIEGHADPAEIEARADNGSAWQIASARATNVLLELQRNEVKVKSVSTAGYGTNVDLTSDHSRFETSIETPGIDPKINALDRARVHLRVVREVKTP